VTLPNEAGREKILRVHARKLPGFQECKGVDPKRAGSLGIDDKVDLSAIASITPGLSGAELEFIVNEAAIRAVRRVSAALREGIEPKDIMSPHVNAKDFEDSVKSFFDTRKPKNDFLRKLTRPNVE
jgi:cell division protease FtsH